MNTAHIRFALAIFAGALAPSSQAAVILDNLTPGTFAGSSVHDIGLNGYQTAVSLSTTALAYTFDSLEGSFVEVTGGAPTITGGIYTDASGVPGTLLQAFNPVTLPGGITSTIQSFTTTSPFTLNASTQYWFVLNNPTSARIAWRHGATAPVGSGGITYGGNSLLTSSAPWTTTSYSNAVRISASAVPEPGSMVFLGLCAATVFKRRRR